MTKSLKSLPGAEKFLPPPGPRDSAKQDLRAYGALRDGEGRVVRSTGRNVQFATIVTPELKAWIKTEARARGKRMCVLLEDMRAAYEKIHGSRKF